MTLTTFRDRRLKGDKEARGIALEPVVEDKDAAKKKKKKVVSTAVKLEDDVVKEIEFVLAQVRPPPLPLPRRSPLLLSH